MSFPEESYEVKKQTLNDAFVTANCAYTRKLLYQIKGFSRFFANNAEDVDLCWRAIRKGAKLLYAPDVIIYAHNVTTLRGIFINCFTQCNICNKHPWVYGGKVNYDLGIYKMLLKNIGGMAKREKDAGLNCIELTSHLFGKYYGSLRYGVINV